MQLDGRSALITGSNQGLGLAIAEAFVREGASVMLCARDVEKLTAASVKLRALAVRPEQVVALQPCDMAEETSLDRLVESTLAQFPHLDILVNNAGVYGPFGQIEEADWNAWKESIAVNLLGPVYLSRRLMPHFRQRGYGKIINLSGGGATAPLPGISSYATAKAGLVRFSETLAQEAAGTGIDINAIAPGALATRLMDQVIDAGAGAVGAAFVDRMKRLRAEGGTPLEVGARCAVYFASAKSDGITGRLVSAVWDPWETLDRHKADIEGTDIYTIRRIVPAERGKPWGEREGPAG